MAQVSYGTITITDTNDIESITIEYARNQSTSTAPTSGWSTTRPEWAEGYYVWQRTRIHKSGTESSSDTFGTAVCLTGSTGQTGSTGRGISSIVTTYCNYGTGTPAASYSGWQSTVPAYDSTKPNYWVKTVITYTTGSPATDTSIYKDNGITDAVSTSAEANATASEAWDKADDAQDDAQEALNLARNTNYAWWSLATEKTVGQNTFAAGSYGTFIRSEDFQNNPTNQPNIFVDANGLYLRRALTNLASFTGTALTFNNPSTGNAQLVIGAKGTLQSGNYRRGSDTKFSAEGTKIDLINGDIITKYFRLSQGLENLNAGAYIHGTIEALDGKIGAGSSNYWEIGQYTDYGNTTNATMVGHGGSFIQLGDSSTWRLATNRIHTGWYATGDTVLHYPQDENNKYWDFGIHVPYSDSPSGRGNDKFIYIRTQKAENNSLQNLLYDLDDNYSTQQWEYKFWIDSNGNVHAPGFYVGNSTTPIGGGANTIAQKIINSDGTTFGKGSTTKPIYIDNNGYVQEIGYTIQTSVPSGAVFTDHITTATTTGSGNAVTSITADANGALTVTKGATFSTTDKNVQSTEANTTKIWLVGTPTSGTRTGTLNYDSGVYITTTAGVLHATTFEGNLSGTASRATADSDGNTIKTTYLKLTGGSVTGAVTFGDSVSVDELTVGDLVVNGSASFTNNLQANTINGVAVGSNPKFTDTVTTVTVTGSGNAITGASALGGAVTLTKGTTFPTGSGTNGYLTKWTGANTIGNGPALGSDATKFLNNKGEWAVPAGTGLTSVSASGSGGITISGSPITTSGTIAIGLDLSTAINGLGEGASPATREDYIVAQYAGGGTTTTSYHRRKLSNIFAALNSSDITTALGYTPPTTDTNTHRPIQLDSTEILGNNTTALNLVTGGGMALSNSSGAVTIAHKDTSSQSSSSNSGRTYIQSITLDTYGHVTGLTTASESVTDTHYTTHLYAGKSDGNTNAATTNGNTYLMVLDNTTVRDRRKISGSGAASVTSDASGNITINSPVAITGVSFANGTITFTKSDSTTIPITTDNFVITQASGATALVKLKSGSTTEYEGYSAGGATTAPVYFDTNGHPAAVTSIPWSLIANTPSSYTPASHTHGNLSNDGKITSTTTIASGDKLVIVDTDSTAGSKITGSSITFGTSTTTFLTNKGTWATPVGTTYTFDGTYNASSNKAATVSTVTNAISALDGGTIGTPSASKTVTAISQTNGNISVTFGDISITKSQISDFPTSMTPAAHNHSQIVTVGDQRSTATTPNSYSNALIFQGLKSKATVGSPSDDTYSYLVGLRGWSDSSGGNSHELAFNNTGIFWRQGATTSWGNWYRIYTTGNKPTASDVGLGNVTNYDSSVAIKSITRSGTTFTYTTVAGGTGTFTQQDNNTWDALSTSQAGYVAKAPNDTSKFLRGDATWAAVTKANVGLGNVDNTADANKRVKGANITTTTNAVAYYTDTAGTFGSKASANGVLYATAANGTLNWGTLPIAQGGTGATTAANARTNLGLGSAATYTAATSVGNNSNLPTGAAVQTYVTNAISGASNTYVTIATDQTITASQKTFNGATRWSVTNSTTGSKYGACNYDATLDALVFSFGTI